MSTNETMPSDENVTRLIGLAAGWIASADMKATALLGMNGTILALAGTGFVFTQKSKEGFSVSAGLMAMFGLAVVASILCAALTIQPRLNREAILKKKGFSKFGSSPTYFFDLAKLNKDKFIERISQDKTAYAKDALEQSIIICHIASAKMQTLRGSVWALVIALIALVAAIVAAVLGK